MTHSRVAHHIGVWMVMPCLAAFGSCASSAAGDPEATGGDRLTDRVWMQAEADRPGVIRTFLSNGTLLMDSCWETLRLEHWQRDGDSIVWTEDTAEIRADVVLLTDAELVFDLQLSTVAERQHFVAADVPYLCPDVPKQTVEAQAELPLTYGCDDPDGQPFAFSVRYIGEAVELGLPDRFARPGLVTVPEVRATSGSKYEGDGILFWTAGERVRLDVDRVTFGPCAQRPPGDWASAAAVADPWEQARAEGVVFRALGQEPFWKLDVVPDRWMLFELMGADPVLTPVPEAQTADGQTVYHAVTEAHDLALKIENTVCYDSMSGHEFEARVIVTLDGTVYHGCGRAP